MGSEAESAELSGGVALVPTKKAIDASGCLGHLKEEVLDLAHGHSASEKGKGEGSRWGVRGKGR